MANSYVKTWLSVNLIGITILCLIVYSYVRTTNSKFDIYLSERQQNQDTKSTSTEENDFYKRLFYNFIGNQTNKKDVDINSVPKKRVDCILDKSQFWLDRSNFSKLVSENREGNNNDVVTLVQMMMDAPSTNMLKRSHNLITTPQAKELLSVMKNKRGGFFIECGALDGERSSNTVVLEVDHGWHGLLIEMDPFFYTQLLAKNRKSWSINACLSPNKYVSYLDYSEDVSGRGQVLTYGLKGESKVKRRVPCFPLESFLLALNRTKVDFFSLDVEGLELKVLETIPFDKIDISVLTVEHLHVVGGKKQLQSFMESQGYQMYKQIDHDDPKVTLYAHDLFFVKKSYLDSIKGRLWS